MVNRVTCITKPHTHSRVEHITHLGGFTPEGNYWYMSREKMIADIKGGNYQFHVVSGGYKVPVIVAGTYPNEYVKTSPDVTTADNLLSLPQCS